MKRNIIILCCVLLVLSGTIILGYYVGKIHSPNAITFTTKFSGKIKKKDLPENVVMSEDNNSYTIGCFWEMYFDEEIGEPCFNMQAAEYVIDRGCY